MILNGNNAIIASIEAYRDRVEYPGLFNSFKVYTNRANNLCDLFTLTIGLTLHCFFIFVLLLFSSFIMVSTLASWVALFYAPWDVWWGINGTVSYLIVFMLFSFIGNFIVSLFALIGIIWSCCMVLDATPLKEIIGETYSGVKNKYCPIIVYNK